jgi:hypothetical protein
MNQDKPNVDAFLDGGVEKHVPAQGVPRIEASRKAKAVTPDPVQPVAKTSPVKRTKKLFELPESLVSDLEQRCVDERRQKGRRVTQTEIVVSALRTYLYGKK